MDLNPKIKECLEEKNRELYVEKHPFFVDLNAGRFSKEEFLKTQIEFSHAVRFFNRPMALVAANIPDAIKRVAIVDNLWEEHGRGKADEIHGKTILTLVDRLGGNSEEIDESSLTPNIQIFNQAIRSVASFEDYRFSTAVFGGIERSFVNISTEMCRAIEGNGWLPSDRITHYALHKEIDIQHAEDFLKVSNDDWDNEVHRANIEKGIVFGGNLFLNIYTGFHKELTA